MATIYISSTGSNTSPYDTWAKAAPATEAGRTAVTATLSKAVTVAQQGMCAVRVGVGKDQTVYVEPNASVA